MAWAAGTALGWVFTTHDREDLDLAAIGKGMQDGECARIIAVGAEIRIEDDPLTCERNAGGREKAKNEQQQGM